MTGAVDYRLRVRLQVANEDVFGRVGVIGIEFEARDQNTTRVPSAEIDVPSNADSPFPLTPEAPVASPK